MNREYLQAKADLCLNQAEKDSTTGGDSAELSPT
jgi:hypothetical protein